MKQKIDALIRIAAEESSNLIVIADAQARVYWVNQSFVDHTGYLASEVNERSLGFLFRHKEDFDHTFEGKKEVQWSAKGQDPFWIYMNQIRTTLNGESYILIVANIISKLKDLELLSREQQVLIDGFSNSFSEVNIVVSPRFEIMALNKLAIKLFKSLLNVDLSKRSPLLQDFPPDIKVYLGSRIYKAFKGNRIREKRYSKRFDKYYNLGFYPITYSKNNIIAVSIHIKNITKEVKYLNRLRKQKNRIARIAWENSHYIRRPVANIVGLSDWLHTHQVYSGEKGYMVRKILENSVDLDRKVKILSRQLEKFA